MEIGEKAHPVVVLRIVVDSGNIGLQKTCGQSLVACTRNPAMNTEIASRRMF